MTDRRDGPNRTTDRPRHKEDSLTIIGIRITKSVVYVSPLLSSKLVFRGAKHAARAKWFKRNGRHMMGELDDIRTDGRTDGR